MKLPVLLSMLVQLPVIVLLAIAALPELTAAGTIVQELPGYSGQLPFKLETGYIGVGETEDIQLFYYFIESKRSPSQDPLLLWLSGGPGCSPLTGIFTESGPLFLNSQSYEDGLPSLMINPYSWTQGVSILYLDSPVGTGFSYSMTSQGYDVDDYKSSQQIYDFLQKWFKDHPEFMSNEFYVGGESYSGIIIPMITQRIYIDIEAQKIPYINLKGYLLSSPHTDSFVDHNAVVAMAHRLSLISDELYESTRTNCEGNYVNVIAKNLKCQSDMSSITQLLGKINNLNILEPYCGVSIEGRRQMVQMYPGDNSHELVANRLQTTPFYCRSYTNALIELWANDGGVREALHVEKGTKVQWAACNGTLGYTQDVKSSVPYHLNLTSTTLRALIFSGDHDLSIPHIATMDWINSLNLTMEESWRAWMVDGQVSGYTKRYTHNDYTLTFATVKGAGHMPQVYKVKEASKIVDRWLSYYPI